MRRYLIIASLSLCFSSSLWAQTGYDAVLFRAAESGDVDSLLTALANGASVFATNQSDSATALMVAGDHGNEDVALVLIQRGVRIDSYDRDRWTALHFASSSGSIRVVKELLRRNIDPNMVNKIG
ncbi:MAG: ankyrin repeat domain-containing protein, partial [Rhodothermales bacterium]|nr:ankyrin repeat domain-containing protein [Rhodothermales bacterium]